MNLSLIPESAPFNEEQRAWLNGFFAGLLGMNDGAATATANGNGAAGDVAGMLNGAGGAAAAEVEEEEDFPWHDPALPMDDRLALAKDKPLPRRLMSAMAQLDCGACGYLCKTYSEAISRGDEKNLTLCSPGGKHTAKMLKKLLKEEGGAGSGTSAGTNGSSAAAASPAKTNSGYDRNNPYLATLVCSKNLNLPGSAKHTSHVVLDLGDSGGLTYRVGDSLGVYPTNCPDLVGATIALLRADPLHWVTTSDGKSATLRRALSSFCNLRYVDEDLVLLVAEFADKKDAARLKQLADDDDALGVMDLFDLLQHYPRLNIDVERLVAALTPLTPRLYSIANSPKLHPGEVHLTIARATAEVGGRIKKGVASTMFADRVPPGERVPVFVQPSHGFTLPEDSHAPIIMVGPGTGVAPFRAFLEERQALQGQNGGCGESWLLFGDQRSATDFLYAGEFESLRKSKVLTRLDTAFSRDQGEKVYVQHRMREHGAELFRWLERGAHFFVCGDAKRMAADVDRALHDVVVAHGNRSAEEAKSYVAELTRTKRYLRDVY